MCMRSFIARNPLFACFHIVYQWSVRRVTSHSGLCFCKLANFLVEQCKFFGYCNSRTIKSILFSFDWYLICNNRTKIDFAMSIWPTRCSWFSRVCPVPFLLLCIQIIFFWIFLGKMLKYDCLESYHTPYTFGSSHHEIHDPSAFKWTIIRFPTHKLIMFSQY